MTNVYVNSQVNAQYAANTEAPVTTVAPKAVKINKRVRAEEIFNRELPKLDQKNPTPWRTNVVQMIMADLGITINNASTIYNYAKKRAVAEGKIGEFGRSPAKAVLAKMAEDAKAAEQADAAAAADAVDAAADAAVDAALADVLQTEGQEEVKMPPVAGKEPAQAE